jgi:predicted TIM-barrel fold metal-dependent hydrolase
VAFDLFSADDHVVEHARVWTDRVSTRHRERAPHVIEEDGREYWVYEDVKSPQMGLNAVAGKRADEYTPDPIRYSDMIPGCYDPLARAGDMLHDGIRASVCFPTLPRFGGALFNTFRDKGLADECVRAYNDFIIEEWCASVPGLYVPMVIGQLWDPRGLGEEVRRCAARGARAITFPENTVPLGLPSFFTDHWDPFWEAVTETDSVVCMHIGTSGGLTNPSPDAPGFEGMTPVTIAVACVNTFVAAVNLAMSPVPRKFPDVKIVFSEGGIGWVPAAVERADREWLRHKYWTHSDDMLPSEVFRRNFWFCMIEEPVGLQFREYIGVDRILWECDYPHVDTTWPWSQKAVEDLLGPLPEDERQAIAHGNAERLFRWEMEPLATT